ncbi:MAG TPA: hypothetical protein PLC12_04370, partial [Candidatus Methanofastidiosa archaeon]|nr:hypothetical protein [Candidatus Methanofastidiosa archaeon]
MQRKRLAGILFFLFASLAIIVINRSYRTHGFQEFIWKEAIFYLALPAIVLMAIRKDPRDYGLSLGDKRKLRKYFIILFLAAVPFMLIGASMSEYQNYYPRFYYN